MLLDKYEILGLNDYIVFYSPGRENVLKLAYDPEKKIFHENFTGSTITRYFVYKNKCYDRLKPGNRNKFYKLLSNTDFSKFWQDQL